MKLFGMLIIVAMLSFNASVFADASSTDSQKAIQDAALKAAAAKKHEAGKEVSTDGRQEAGDEASGSPRNNCEVPASR